MFTLIARKLKYGFNSFFNLIYPPVCGMCGEILSGQENYICTQCLYDLHRTKFDFTKENPIHQLFAGRIKLENASSSLIYTKNSKVQKLIHNIKYYGMCELGEEMGRHIGQELKALPENEKPQVIVPVPLHARRKRSRGYNQSEWIAKGISEVTEIPIDTKSLRRKIHTTSQTKKGIYERWENVAKIFELSKPQRLQGKHILLVDDVLTTGSTLEACAMHFDKLENTKVSIFTLAFSSSKVL